MKRLKIMMLVLLIGLVLSLGILATAIAAPQAGYTIAKFSVEGGVYWNSGNGYKLGGTLGQHEDGKLSGGGYTLGGGFWPGGESGAVADNYIYLPLVTR